MSAKLLLADDSVTIQKVVELTLADEEYELTMVSEGSSALKTAETLLPDLIMADIVMPELNGYELCEKIRQNPALAGTPVLLLTSTFETYDEERGKSVGADDHITKPFESEELLQKIRSCLEKKSEATKVAEAPVEEIEVSDMETMEAEPEKVEEEEFDFELTDEFMEEAEEMFDTTEEAAPTNMEPQAESEEVLPEELPALEKIGAEETFDSSLLKDEDVESLAEAEIPEEISPEFAEELPSLEEAEPEIAPTPEMTSQESPVSEKIQSPSEVHEPDQEIAAEEDVDIYEIPEEYATDTELPEEEEAEASKSSFPVEEPPIDLIDEFMAKEEETMVPEPETVSDEDLTKEEIVNAVEEPAPSSEVEAHEESFKDAFPTESATSSEWSPELESYGGTPEAVSDEVVEKPFEEEVVSDKVSAVDEETVRRIVAEMVESMASEIIERVAWEVIPDLAEVLIQKEIQKLRQEVKSS